MPTISALLKSAQSTQKRIAEQQDAQVAFDWSQSAKTYEDFIEYSNYLNSRRAVYNDDPSKLLTLEKTVSSARRAYTSNEIQRQNIDIIEGRGDNTTKYEKLVDLFHQAVDNGDYDQAQTLNLQLDNLSVKMQNEAETAAKALAASGAKTNDNFLKSLEKGVNDVTLPNGSKVTPLAAIARDLEQTGGDNQSWIAAGETLEAIRGAILTQWENASSQDEIDKLEQKYGAGLADLNKELTFSIGGKRLTAEQVYTAAENEKINNPVYGLTAEYNEATGKTDYKLRENDVDRIDYTRQYDEQTGQEYFAPTIVRSDQNKLMFGQSNQGRGLSTQIDNAGNVIGGGDSTGNIRLGTEKAKRQAGQSIEDRLKNMGIIAEQDGTTLKIILPGEPETRRATIQPDGSIRYQDNDGQVREIGLVDRNLGTNELPQVFSAGLDEQGQGRLVAPDEISDFGTASAFGGKLSKASEQGRNYIRNYTTPDILNSLAPVDLRQSRITGMAKPSLNGPIGVGNNFSGRGTPLTSSLLQSANFTQNKVQSELQAKVEAIRLQAQTEAAQRLQQSQVFNLNQTSVQQLASNGVLKRQLSVAPLPAQPRVYVAPPAPTPRITSVGVARPTSRITSVGVAR